MTAPTNETTASARFGSPGSSPLERPTILSLRNICKSYRGRQALKGISLELRQGELLGFFGPNGAGKTTMIRCITGLLKPDAGEISRGLGRSGLAARVGLVPQNLAIYPDLTVGQNLEVFGRLEGVWGAALKSRISSVLHWAALADRTTSLARTLSGGMQRRLNIACGVLHEPDILLLDEPTVGVDPQSRERIYEMLAELRQQGTAVLLTTHQLEEVETRCDRIVVMDQGVIVADGTLPELVQATIGAPHRIALRFDLPVPLETPPLALADFTFAPDRRAATCPIESTRGLPELLAMLGGLDPPPTWIEVRGVGLNEVFLDLTGRSLRE